MLTYCEEVSETLGLLLYNKNGVAKGSETLRLVFTKRMLTCCEEVSETLRLLLYNENGLAKGSETLRLLFHKKNAIRMQKFA